MTHLFCCYEPSQDCRYTDAGNVDSDRLLLTVSNHLNQNTHWLDVEWLTYDMVIITYLYVLIYLLLLLIKWWSGYTSNTSSFFTIIFIALFKGLCACVCINQHQFNTKYIFLIVILDLCCFIGLSIFVSFLNLT